MCCLKPDVAISIVGPSTYNGLSLEMRLLSRNNANIMSYKLLGAPLSTFLEGVLYKFLNE